jgi:arylsulfatase A-like enzyme
MVIIQDKTRMSVSKPDIVFIVLDTHRVDRLGCYGYRRDTSPNLDAFAQQSTVFEKAISPAQWTIPSHASMFSGEYPVIHQIIQASDAISDDFLTLAEYLQRSGYQTSGFCNNPLVGVLNNGFRRGFQEFYNYGGTVPQTPSNNGQESKTLYSKIRKQYFKLIEQIASPIQQAVAASPQVLQIALNPLLVPLWTRYSNFKGDTAASIRDTSNFLKVKGDVPKFVFLNLMGTHLPYAPPRRFIRKFAPNFLDDPDAGEFMSVYNTQALNWLLPLDNPFPPKQAQILQDMYDAEVAYQDYLLNQLLSILEEPEHLENTLVIIVGDHGEMLGEHQIMGHGLGVHEELIHVPMMIRFPGQSRETRIKQVVSTVRVFNTILDTIGIDVIQKHDEEIISTSEFTLANFDAHPEYVFSEAYPPNSLIIIMEKYASDLIDRFQSRETRWAIYNQPYKLIRTNNVRDDVYNYIIDPEEIHALSQETPSFSQLSTELERFLMSAQDRGSGYSLGSTNNLDDETVMKRLRNLGYLD